MKNNKIRVYRLNPTEILFINPNIKITPLQNFGGARTKHLDKRITRSPINSRAYNKMLCQHVYMHFCQNCPQYRCTRRAL